MGVNARNWRILAMNGWVGEQSHPEAPRPVPQNYKVGQKLSYLFIISTRPDITSSDTCSRQITCDIPHSFDIRMHHL
jgi:hypothetical protein